MNMQGTPQPALAINHISVDCVVFCIENDELYVLLVKRDTNELHDMKLPGGMVYKEEILDVAAQRILKDLTGASVDSLRQFRSYSAKGRTNDPRDTHWLSHTLNTDIDSILTVAYFSVVNTKRTINKESSGIWVPLKSIGELAFDHNRILQDGFNHLQRIATVEPSILFEFLPRKFVISQLRAVYSLIYDKEFDVRNFHKQVNQMAWVKPLEERQKNVSHRAARYYKFDKVAYKRFFKFVANW